MTAIYKHPFECQECSQRPKQDFVIFQEGEIDDWMIAYIEQQVIHIHYGYATHEDALNIAEAKFVEQFMMSVAASNPDKKFFVFIDTGRADNSEFIPTESLQIYKHILQHPQFQQGVFYGGTSASNFIMKLLLRFGGMHVKIVYTKQDADQYYREWLLQ